MCGSGAEVPEVRGGVQVTQAEPGCLTGLGLHIHSSADEEPLTHSGRFHQDAVSKQRLMMRQKEKGKC